MSNRQRIRRERVLATHTRVQRDPGLVFMKTDMLFQKIRGDPRFCALLRKLNLPVE